MLAILEEVKSAAAALSNDERAELMDYLEIVSHVQPDSVRAEWSAVAAQRMREHDVGLRQAVPFNSVFKRLVAD